MGQNNVARTVAELVAPLVEACGIELVEVDYVKEGGRWFLRILIDKPGGIMVEDCELISRRIDPVLDTHDPVPHAYTLEVSSPGVDRPLNKLADYQRFAGERIRLTTFVPMDGQRRFIGILGPANEHFITLDVDGKQVVIPMEQVASARLAFQF